MMGIARAGLAHEEACCARTVVAAEDGNIDKQRDLHPEYTISSRNASSIEEFEVIKYLQRLPNDGVGRGVETFGLTISRTYLFEFR